MICIIGIVLIVVVICVVYFILSIVFELYGYGLVGKPIRLREEKIVDKNTREIKSVRYIIEAKSTMGIWVKVDSGYNKYNLSKAYEELAKEVGKIKPDLVSRSEIISSTETKVKIEYKNGK
jgi:hypothetical protein